MATDTIESPHTLDEQYVDCIPSGEPTERFAITGGSTTAFAHPILPSRRQTSQREAVNAWLLSTIKQLRAIERLPAGWDSHGAPQPDERILSGARGFLQSLAQAEELSRPRVNPTPAGGVQLEWENESRYFEIELTSPTEARCYFCDNNTGQEDVILVRYGDPLDKVLSCIAHVSAR